LLLAGFRSLKVIYKWKEMWCDVAKVFVDAIVDKYEENLCLFLFLHRKCCACQVISFQQKRCKITTQEATRTKNELMQTALLAVHERV